MKKIFLFLATLLPLALNAAEVSKEKATAMATLLMTERVDGFNSEILTVNSVDYDGQKAYYVVQFKQGGWAIIAADDNSSPLIGYSPKGEFRIEDQPENLAGMMEVYAQQVVGNARRFKERHSGWDVEQRPAEARRNASSKIKDLIKVNWNQTGKFQKYCPKNDQGQAVVGCVAVGMAQAMSVAQWPPRPIGSFSYNSASFGYQSINYDEEPDYNWDNILSGANNADDVARLLWHCGVSVRMDYGVSGSGTQTAYIAGALKNYFQYPQSVQYYSRSSYSGDWEELILTELREGRAVAYSGHDPVKNYGHCFNLDGYDGQWFHVNWGWGGNGNGYFGLDGLRDAKMDMDYTEGQAVIVGVRAPSDKPSNILLSNNTIQAMKPAGSIVGSVIVESEATNPTYTFKVTGEYSVLFHTYLPAPFEVIEGNLVTTDQLLLEDYPEGIGIEITATNNQNNASVTRHFTILVTKTDGIVDLSATEADVVSEAYYSAAGQLLDVPVKGLIVVRQKLSDGTVRTLKKMIQ